MTYASWQLSHRTKVVLSICALALLILYPLQTRAGVFSKVEVRFDRMAASATSTGTVCLAPTVTTAINAVKVTFPTGYTLAAVSGTSWRVSTSNLAWPSGASALTGVTTADQVSSQTVRFPLTSPFTPSAGTLYCFNWTDASATQPGSAGADKVGTVESHSNVGGSALIDTGDYATATATGGDQISVSATVTQTFNLTLANTSQNLGTLSTGSVTESGTDATARVDTNAKNGWQMWAKDTSNAGLRSTLASYTIASTTPGTNSTLVAGTEGYNMGATSSTGTGACPTATIDTAFVHSATLGRGGGLDNTLRTVATCGNTSSNVVLTLPIDAAISGVTPAANDYADTITVVAAGLF